MSDIKDGSSFWAVTPCNLVEMYLNFYETTGRNSPKDILAVSSLWLENLESYVDYSVSPCTASDTQDIGPRKIHCYLTHESERLITTTSWVSTVSCNTVCESLN
jgi:hypothetical protein